MTTNPQTPVTPYRHYFYDDATKIIYHTSGDGLEEHSDLIFIGSSDNPNPKAAAAFFMQSGKVSEGFRLKDYDNQEG